jgi:hypothetical protein
MPYIKKENRPKYNAINEQIMGLIPATDSPLTQASKVASYVSFLIREIKKISKPHLVYSPQYTKSTGTEQKLALYAMKIARTLPSKMEDMAGELNYSLSHLCWGLCGDAPNRPSARYCMRAFIKGALKRAFFANLPYYTDEEYIFFSGVLDDVIVEIYRRRTAPYEDQKIEECGDLWVQ